MSESPEQQWMESQRKKLALKQLGENPNYVLVEVKKSKRCKLDCFERKNLMVPTNYSFLLVIQDIRQRIPTLDKSQALFCYVNGSALVRSDLTVGELNEKYQNDEGFLQIEFSDVQTFG